MLSLGLVGNPLAKSPPIPPPDGILEALLTEFEGDRESLAFGALPELLPTTLKTYMYEYTYEMIDKDKEVSVNIWNTKMIRNRL